MKIIRKEDVLVDQPRLGVGVYFAALIAMVTVQWMTLDMYLPALPVLKQEFAANEALLNFSFNSNILFCAIGTLIGGTLSDKYGRKPIIIVGLVLAIVGLFGCAASNNVIMLTIQRGIAGFGGGVAQTIALAVGRDSFTGQTFKTTTTISQAAAVIGPVFAPAIGSSLIEYFSWRWIFLVAAIGTLATLIPILFAKETWPKEKRHVDSVWAATKQTLLLGKNGTYLCFMGTILLLTIPLWAYLAVCSYIYYDGFHVSNLQYTGLYTVGTIISCCSPFVYMALAKKQSSARIVKLCMIIVTVAAIMLVLMGSKNPVLFLVAMVPIFLAEGVVRPLCTVEVLERYKEQAGSASALNTFFLMFIGVVASSLATMSIWPTFILGLAIISVCCVAAAFLFWLPGRKFIKE